MKRPSFQFYTKDWRTNPNLRRCSPAARGVWIDVLCVLHDSDDQYGLVHWPLVELASVAAAPVKLLEELASKSVLKGSDTGVCDAYVYIPRTARKDGPPVVLVPAQSGPVWFSSRMVRDEYIRRHAGATTRFGTKPAANQSPSRAPSRRQGAEQGE